VGIEERFRLNFAPYYKEIWRKVQWVLMHLLG